MLGVTVAHRIEVGNTQIQRSEPMVEGEEERPIARKDLQDTPTVAGRGEGEEGGLWKPWGHAAMGLAR